MCVRTPLFKSAVSVSQHQQPFLLLLGEVTHWHDGNGDQNDPTANGAMPLGFTCALTSCLD